MQRIVCFFSVAALSASLSSFGSVTALYTNAPSGSTVTLASEISVMNPLGGTNDQAAGILFDGGSGNGTLSGSGNFSVSNTASSTQLGAEELYGIQAASLNITQYTGNIRVVNNQSAYADSENTTAIIYGVGGKVTGDVIGDVSVIANGRMLNASEDIFVDASATGFYGDLIGRVIGDITVIANGGIADASEDISIDTSSTVSVTGIDGTLTGNLSGSLFVTANGGTASSSALSESWITISSFYSSTSTVIATGIGGDLRGDLRGTLAVTANGGRASSVADADVSAFSTTTAYGIYGNLIGDLTGTLAVTANGERVTASPISWHGSVSADANADVFASGIHGSLSGDLGGMIVVNASGASVSSDAYGRASRAFASAHADAFGIENDLDGDLTGTITVTASGGKASASFPGWEAFTKATAVASAHGIGGNLNGDLSGSINVSTTGGTASALAYSGHFRGPSVNAETFGSSLAHGIHGDMIGDLNGAVNVSVNGGIAFSSTSSKLRRYAERGAAKASATASAYGVSGNLTGDLSGNINVTATGGTADAYSYADNYTVAVAEASASAYGVYGDLAGNLSGNITVIVTGGTASAYGSSSAFAYADTHASASADASASAYGILGDLIGDVSGNITVTATGGIAPASAADVADASAEAKASGVEGDQINISNFTGNVSAQAIAGLEIENGVTNVATASAKGISANEMLYLNALSGSIHAIAEGSEDSTALAIEGGTQSDTVFLGDVDLIGDIDLNTGTNQITIFGDTRIEGDIVATDGWNDFTIQSGMLTPVGTVRISNLYNNRLNIASSGGFGFELVGNSNSSLNSKVMIDGVLTATDPVAMAAVAAEGTSAKDLFGNRYEVIVADGFDATFFDSMRSLFDLDIEVGSTNVWITPTGLKPQVGGSTPSGNSLILATTHSAQTVMHDLSARSGSMRSLLKQAASKRFSRTLASASTSDQRQRVNNQLNDIGIDSLLPDESPSGIRGVSGAGPLMEEKWVLFVRQFMDLGSQDSDGSIAGFDWKSSGSIVGAEKLLDQSLLIGLAGGMVWTDLDGKEGAGGGASKMGVATLYGTYFTDTWFAEAGFSYAHAWNDTQRIATDGQHYTGTYESDLMGLWLEFGYELPVKTFRVEPYLGNAYLSGNHRGYTDQGGTAPLSMEANGTDQWQVETGLRGRREWMLSNGDRLSLELKAAWQREMLDNAVSANGSLLGVGQTLRSPETDRDALVLGIKTDWQMNEAFTFSLDYAPTLAKNWHNHSINVTLNYEF